MKKFLDTINKGNLAIMIVILLIIGFVGFQVYSVTHIELKTQTATVSTTYESISTEALIIRKEVPIENGNGAVTVPSFQEGDKIKVGGNVAMVFNSDKEATDYSKYVELQKQIAYYENLGSQTVGQASGLDVINKDIQQKVLNYAYSASKNSIDEEEKDLNSVLIRRQLIIGEDIDLDTHIQDLAAKAVEYANAQPIGFVNTDFSGVYSSFVDGYETVLDYDNAMEQTIEGFEETMASVGEPQNTSGYLGKLITGYDWYIQAVVDTEALQGLTDGSIVQVALKDNKNTVIRATIVKGADIELGQERTLLTLRCNLMNDALARARKTEIEIRRGSFEGIKVPSEALHIVDGKKGVYVLIASQIKFREATVIHSADDYVMIEYDPANPNAVHLYDKIITQGKDLENGKVYT